jgi:type I restriction enzyme S subunit
MDRDVPLLPLSDLASEIIDRPGVTPLKLGSDFTTEGSRVISAKLIKSGRVALEADEARFVDAPTYRKWMRSPLRADDVIMTSEAPLGELAYLAQDSDWCLGQRLYAIRPNPGRCHGRYLYYALQSEPAKSDIQSRATGTTVVGIRQTELWRVLVPTPPLAEQRAIASVLGALDDKIDLNRRMCQTLEEMARALFKSWFVDYDPVRAKMEGRDPGLPKEIADLFPSRLVDSELGPIPEGWVVQRLAEGFAITMGQSPPGSSYNETGDGLAFFQGRADFGFRFPRYRVYTIEPTRFAEAGDTLVSVRAPVGDVNMAPSRCCVGRGVAAVRHQSGACSYTYYAMKFLEPEFEKFESEGTVFGSISKRDFHGLRLPAPSSVVLRAFEEKCGALDGRIETAEREQATLAALRDTLLPKLISGEVRVPASLGSMQEVST